MKSLIETLHTYCDDQSFVTSWHLKNLRTEETADRWGDEVLPSASTRKIAIMMAALEQVNRGELDLQQPIAVREEFQDNTSGTFQHLTPGFTITLRDAITMMIIVSDNTCTGTICDMLGLDAINDYSSRVGMTGTAHRMPMGMKGQPADHPVEAGNATTVNDLGHLLDLILAGTESPKAAGRLGCTMALCQLALEILCQQKLRARLPFLLPPGTRVGHKTGTGKRNINDAGIVFGSDEQPLFVLAVITDEVPAGDVQDGVPGVAAAAMSIQKMARMCYDQLS